MPLAEAIREGGQARFRPVLLTSLTTFAGLAPLLAEGSVQAQFLIPMAASLLMLSRVCSAAWRLGAASTMRRVTSEKVA